MAHLRALGFEACAVFYNVSAAYLALLQPAAALPYLCKARMLAHSLGLADGSGQAVHTARRSHIGGAVESALALTLRRPKPFLPPSLSPGALSLMHCTSLCRGGAIPPAALAKSSRSFRPRRQRTISFWAALRCSADCSERTKTGAPTLRATRTGRGCRSRAALARRRMRRLSRSTRRDAHALRSDVSLLACAVQRCASLLRTRGRAPAWLWSGRGQPQWRSRCVHDCCGRRRQHWR